MISLGYELGSGERVKIPLNHTVVLGQTQLSGKTTTLEAMVTRSDLRAVGFITKPGESSFRLQTQIPAFFSESSAEEYWKHVVAMLEYRSEVKLGWRERGVVIKLCQEYKKEGSRIGFDSKSGKSKRERISYKWKVPKLLHDVLNNLELFLPYARSSEEMICIQLREFLRPVISEIEKTQFSDKLLLARGINVMDITELSDGLKALVIRSVIEWVHKHGRKIVVIIPEAWKFIPEGRSTPVKLALEGLIREGAGVGNFVWMDSQDLRGVDKLLLRSVIVWLFGVQRQKNEVASTLASIPDHPKPSATEIMQLGKGEFYVCYGSTLVRTYVQPAGMEDAHAQAIARGEERPESWTQIVRSLDAEDRLESHGESSWSNVAETDDAPPASGADSNTTERNQTGAIPAADVRGIAGTAGADGEDEMWKEKYEALCLELTNAMGGKPGQNEFIGDAVRQLVAAHDALAARIRASEAAGETVLHVPSSNGNLKPGLLDTSDLDGIYRYILSRAAAEEAKAILTVLVDRPEIIVNVERKKIEANSSTLRGALGILISEKFFDGARAFGDVRSDLIRRGFLGTKAPNLQISLALQGLVELGFLTKEETGYQAVVGMKINIVETRA